MREVNFCKSKCLQYIDKPLLLPSLFGLLKFQPSHPRKGWRPYMLQHSDTVNLLTCRHCGEGNYNPYRRVAGFEEQRSGPLGVTCVGNEEVIRDIDLEYPIVQLAKELA
jgi:hypothetical protein